LFEKIAFEYLASRYPNIRLICEYFVATDFKSAKIHVLQNVSGVWLLTLSSHHFIQYFDQWQGHRKVWRGLKPHLRPGPLVHCRLRAKPTRHFPSRLILIISNERISEYKKHKKRIRILQTEYFVATLVHTYTVRETTTVIARLYSIRDLLQQLPDCRVYVLYVEVAHGKGADLG